MFPINPATIAQVASERLAVALIRAAKQGKAEGGDARLMTYIVRNMITIEETEYYARDVEARLAPKFLPGTRARNLDYRP